MDPTSFFISLAISMIVAVGSAMLAKSAKVSQPDPATLDDIDMPRAESGVPITYVMGSDWVSGSNVVYYGNLRTRPIKESSGGGK